MLSELAMTGVAAAAAGGLVLPATRRLMLGSVEHDWLADELEFDRVDDGQTVRMKDGTLIVVYRLRGTSYDAKVMAQQNELHKNRAALWHLIGTKGVGFRLFGVKRRREITLDAEWPSQALSEVGEAERSVFQSSYFVDWFVALAAKSAKSLDEACDLVPAMVSDYAPQVLSQPEEPDVPCELTGFLNFLVSGDLRRDLPAISQSISGRLPAADLVPDRDTGLITANVPTPKLHRVIAVREWPEKVTGQVIGELMALQADIEVSMICDPWERDHALVLYKRKLKEQQTALIGNPELAAECKAIIDLLSAGQTTIFNTQLQVIVRADDEGTLNDQVKDVCEILGHLRIIHSVETEGAAVCWFNRLPRNPSRILKTGYLLRPLILREDNIGALWAFQHSATGDLASPYGDGPVRFFRTPSGQVYSMQFHVDAARGSRGNFLVFAPTGGGKSTLLLHLLGGLAKFHGVRSYIFDSKEGARFMVEAFGGVYQGYDDLQLNPLDVGDDTKGNRHRIYSILKAMAPEAADIEGADEELAHAIEMAFKVDPPERTLDAVYGFAFSKRSPLRKMFAKWVTDEKGTVGLHSHVFNSGHDSLGSFLGRSHMVGINMNEALDDATLGPPVVAHISAAISKTAAMSAQNGFAIFIDEAAKLLQNAAFRNLAMEMFREYRKLNGAVGLAFQDPAALFRCGDAEAFIENTATFIFFPNSLATRQSLEPFNLNDEQIAFITGEGERRGGRKRQVLVVKRDAATGFDESCIIDVNLAPLGDALRFYRAGVDANRDLEELKTKWGDQWLERL